MYVCLYICVCVHTHHCVYIWVFEQPHTRPEQRLTFTHEAVLVARGPPLLLDESRAAHLALGAAGVVLAPALELVQVVGVGDVAHICVAVAHAPASNTDVFDGVEVLQGRIRFQMGYGSHLEDKGWTIAVQVFLRQVYYMWPYRKHTVEISSSFKFFEVSLNIATIFLITKSAIS